LRYMTCRDDLLREHRSEFVGSTRSHDMSG
jgi:hypothetical protein